MYFKSCPFQYKVLTYLLESSIFICSIFRNVWIIENLTIAVHVLRWSGFLLIRPYVQPITMYSVGCTAMWLVEHMERRCLIYWAQIKPRILKSQSTDFFLQYFSILSSVWEGPVVLGSTKTALKLKYEI